MTRPDAERDARLRVSDAEVASERKIILEYLGGRSGLYQPPKEMAVWLDLHDARAENERTTQERDAYKSEAASHLAALNVVATMREQLLSALATLRAADEHLGYEPDIDNTDGGGGDIHDWYCRGRRCGQPFGKPHLDDCEVAAALPGEAAR